MIAYKFLRSDGTGVFTGFRWPSQDEWVDAPVDPCRSGIHACRASDLPYWVAGSLYEVELGGDVLELRMKVVAPRARLVRHIPAWEEEVRDEYTRMCADRAHELAASAPESLEDWDAVVEPSVREGPALLGFVAARIAERISGRDAYFEERARQADWLAERLGLSA